MIWGRAFQHGLWKHFDEEANWLVGSAIVHSQKGFVGNIDWITMDNLIFLIGVYTIGNLFASLVFVVELLRSKYGKMDKNCIYYFDNVNCK